MLILIVLYDNGMPVIWIWINVQEVCMCLGCHYWGWGWDCWYVSLCFDFGYMVMPCSLVISTYSKFPFLVSFLLGGQDKGGKLPVAALYMWYMFMLCCFFLVLEWDMQHSNTVGLSYLEGSNLVLFRSGYALYYEVFWRSRHPGAPRPGDWDKLSENPRSTYHRS